MCTDLYKLNPVFEFLYGKNIATKIIGAALSNKQNDSHMASGASNGKEHGKEKEDIAATSIAESTFARRIRVLRRVLGLSASELDRQVGFGAGTIGRLERGNQRIYASHLYRVGETAGYGS